MKQTRHRTLHEITSKVTYEKHPRLKFVRKYEVDVETRISEFHEKYGGFFLFWGQKKSF